MLLSGLKAQGIIENNNLGVSKPFESNLPLIKITTTNDEEIIDDDRIQAHMGIIDNDSELNDSESSEYNAYDGFISIEFRGTSSQMFEKKGYGLETQNEDGSNNNVELLGMPKENDWVLHGPYSDKSLLRNDISYYMGRKTGEYAPRTRLCELFINGSYEGVYLLTEKIKQDKNRVNISEVKEEDNSGDELTGGYLIKIDRNDAGFEGRGWESSFPDFKYYAYEEPKHDDITAQQKSYIENYIYFFELAMTKDDYQQTYVDYIDLKSWVDYFLVTEISKHIDAYKLSFYMYKKKDSNGGKLHVGPLWDFNLGYGNFNFSCWPGPEGWAYEFPDCGSWHPFWARKINDIPQVQDFTSCRWEELRSGPFRTDSLMAYIDGQIAHMGEAVGRNFERWDILGQYVWPNNFYGRNYQEDVASLKNWLKDRLDWMDENMQGNCENYVSNTKIITDQALIISPNPANEFVNVRMETSFGGEMELYDSQGNRVLKMSFKNSEELKNIDIKGLSNGVYILKILSNEGNQNLQYIRLISIIR